MERRVIEPVLYHNAIVYTMDERAPRCEALLVRGGRIAAVGSSADLVAANPGVNRVDLEGHVAVPGFNDCHCHILGLGEALDAVDVSPPGVGSIADIRDRISERAKNTPEGQWIIAAGYDQNELAERRHPTRDDLDDVSAGHPVLLRHTSTHVLTCNSTALELAGRLAESTLAATGEIVLDQHGRPTGVMQERARRLVEDLLPEPTLEQATVAILRAVQHMASFGITSATDLMTGHGDSLALEVDAYLRAAGSEGCLLRVGLSPQITYVAPPGSGTMLRPSDFPQNRDEDWLQIRTTKVFTDGALSTRTAAMREPYVDSNDRGILIWRDDELVDMMSRAQQTGWQIATHALGDRALDQTLNAYEAILGGSPGTRTRHRVEHCMVVDEGQARLMADLRLVPVIQPDIFRLGDGYLASLGSERAANVIPLEIFKAAGLSPAFSSDAPVIPCDPLSVMRSAVERRTPSGLSLGTRHRATLAAGIRHYTVDSALATRTESVRGKLAVGMLADFAVLSTDPFAEPVDLDALRVIRTVVGGRTSYEA